MDHRAGVDVSMFERSVPFTSKRKRTGHTGRQSVDVYANIRICILILIFLLVRLSEQPNIFGAQNLFIDLWLTCCPSSCSVHRQTGREIFVLHLSRNLFVNLAKSTVYNVRSPVKNLRSDIRPSNAKWSLTLGLRFVVVEHPARAGLSHIFCQIEIQNIGICRTFHLALIVRDNYTPSCTTGYRLLPIINGR